MARKKEFDPEVVLTKAMNLFWLKGYDATSVDELCLIMEIKRGSLYDTFGNKHSLFVKSLDKYVVNMYGKASSAIQNKSAIDAISGMFNIFAQESINDLERRGCFLVNSITELSATNSEIRKIGIEQSNNFEQFFFDLVVRGKDNGEIDQGVDAKSVSQFLVSSFFGLRVSGKVNPNKKYLKNIVDTTISIFN